MRILESFQIKARQPLTEKLPESVESSRFVSHRARISGRVLIQGKDSQSRKLERMPLIFVKRSFMRVM